MIKKLLAAIAMATVVFIGTASTAYPVKTVEAAQKSSLLLCNEEDGLLDLHPGEKQTFIMKVKSYQILIINPKFEANLPDEAPFEVLETRAFQLLNGQKSYTNLYINSDDKSENYIEVTIRTRESAKVGKYKFDLQYEYGMDGTTIVEGDNDFLQRIPLTGVITNEKLPAELAISGVTTSTPLRPGEKTEVTFRVKNVGELEAMNVRVSASYDGRDILPDYSDYTKRLGNLSAGEEGLVTLPLKVLPEAAGHLLTLPINISYKDAEGVSYTVNENNLLYLELIEGEKEEEGKTDYGHLLVSNVKQFPEQPKPGENVSLTFDLTNSGEKDYTELRMSASYTADTGFEPINAEPYRYIGTVPAGKSVTASITVKAGKNIAAGLNNLTLNFNYLTADKNTATCSEQLYVLNVQSKEETLTNSKPKLMVTDFSTGEEDLKTGESFDFTFSVFNTHNDIAAKNIKVTVSSETFTVTKGSNSFFIPMIEPGSEKEVTINLKANASAMTGSYPINILMEYEYDGMPASGEASMNGISVTETKMLLVKENLRVSIENLSIGGWLGASVGATTQLTFSVYNMGKSPLNNVYFTLDGDFAIANGSSYYYGTLQPGFPDFVEMDVTPLLAGEANGILTVHMEDSNGDEVTFESDVNTFVMEQNGGQDYPGENDYPGYDDPVNVDPVKKVKALLPVQAFIAILVAVFFVGLFVTRGIMIVCYKKKLKKQDIQE